MLARTRGPSRKPVCAATNSSAASETSVRRIKGSAAPRGQEAVMLLEEHGVERLAFLVRNPEEQISHQQAGHGQRQRHGHVVHGAFAGLHPRFAQDGEAVAHGLNPGVGAGPHAVCAQHQQGHPQPAELAVRGGHVRAGVLPNLTEVGQVRAQGVNDDKGVGQHKHDEDRHPGQHRLLGAAQIQQRQEAYAGNLHRAACNAGRWPATD